ncbi:MAG: extracellular solute-binding protein [Clostridia bacterium]|nr:extracellular solute-binding protein [Clostridia bacterium]
MKRTCLFLLTALLLALLPATGLAEGTLNQLCTDGEHIYRLAGDALWLADDDLTPTEQLHAFDQPVQALCLADGIFYFAHREDDGMRFFRLDESGASEPLFWIDRSAAIAQMAVYQDCVYIQWDVPTSALSPHNREMAGYAMDGTPLTLPFAEASAIAAVESRGLLVGFDNEHDEGNFFCYNAETNEYQKLNINGIIFDLTASPDGKTIYYRDFMNLCSVKWEQDKYVANKFALWTEESADTDMICTRDQIYTYYKHGDLNAQSWPIERQSGDAGQLTLVNCGKVFDQAMNAAIAQFQQMHPDVHLSFETLSREQLNAALMANDGSIDIFLLDDSIADVVNAGAVRDLNQDDQLRPALERWIGGSLGCWKGVRAGVPIEVFAHVLALDPQLAQYAPEIDTRNCTWLEFLQAVEQFPSDTDGDGHPDMALLGDDMRFPMWMNQYIASFDEPEAIQFDTETFRQLAETYQRCAQSGQIADLFDGAAPPAVYSASDIGLYCSPGLSHMASEYCVPRVKDCAFPTAQTSLLAISSGTKHYDWASDFLMSFISNEAQYDESNVGPLPDRSFYPSYALFSDDDKALLEQADAVLNQAQPEWIDLDFTLFCGDQTEAYLTGRIALDELIQSLQQKLNMVLLG